MNEEKPKKIIAPLITPLLPLIWQSFVEAIVAFFTTIGLEAWWKKNEKNDKS